jgi:glycosyltransferase involved in cell wall biosynthesis
MSEMTPSLTVAVCTRGRPDQVRATLDALDRGAPGVPVIVVDQGPAPERELAERGRRDSRLRVLHDDGRGLSRARNLALRAAETDWIAYVDDDCLVAADFGEALAAELREHPDVDWVAGNVDGNEAAADDLPPVTTFSVTRALVRRGARTLPGAIGFGVLFCVRRSTAERLGGWDERLGPGVPDFPAADDMDFNYRLLRDGGTALLSPRVRAVHDQWRAPEEVVALQRGYSRAWAGFACKQLRGGDVGGGLRLWLWGAVDVLDMCASAARRRSPMRARIAVAKLRGLLEGTARGLGRRW